MPYVVRHAGRGVDLAAAPLVDTGGVGVREVARLLGAAGGRRAEGDVLRHGDHLQVRTRAGGHTGSAMPLTQTQAGGRGEPRESGVPRRRDGPAGRAGGRGTVAGGMRETTLDR